MGSFGRKLGYCFCGLFASNRADQKQEETGQWSCKDNKDVFFDDFSDEEANKWIAKLQWHPLKWPQPIKHAGWRDVTNVYILANKDKCIPPALQEQVAQLIDAKLIKLEVGHMGQLNHTQELADVIATEAA